VAVNVGTASHGGGIATIQTINNPNFNPEVFVWVEQEIDLFFKVNDQHKGGGESANRAILTAFESEVYRVLRTMSRTMNAQAKLLLRSKKAGITRRSHYKLFPWMPWPGNIIVPHGVGFAGKLAEVFDVSKPLVGQRMDGLNLPIGRISVAQFHLPSLGVGASTLASIAARGLRLNDWLMSPRTSVIDINTFELVSLEFEAGSLWPTARVRRKILSNTIVFLGLGFVGMQASEHIDIAWHDHQFSQSVQTAKQGPIVDYCGDRFSLDRLRSLREDALDYSAHGISPQEARCRIGEEQVALNLALDLNLPVDGKRGKRTRDAEQQFGLENKVKGTIQNEEFRGKLALQFKPPSERWWISKT
jgi:hypothetical protein